MSNHCYFERHARLAQSVEHQTFNLRVMGSSPLSGDKYFITTFWNYLKAFIHFYKTFQSLKSRVLGSIVVSIPACHAGDRGSIPRRGVIYFYSFSALIFSIKYQFFTIIPQGGLAQMVERSLSMREVLGSMPRSSNIIIYSLHHTSLFSRRGTLRLL